MAVHKRKKNTRQRASMSHGWGAKKKHRGAGNRGGRGNAGTGKRADQKKPSIWKEKYFGKFGFVYRRNAKAPAVISLRDIGQTMDNLIKQGFAEKKDGGFIVNLEKAGYDKLVSQGQVNDKITIHVQEASETAIEKVKEKGGDVVVAGSGAKSEDKKKRAKDKSSLERNINKQ